jgi:hypothetical protein
MINAYSFKDDRADPAAPVWPRYAGNCTATVSVTSLDVERIDLELRLTPRCSPRTGSLTIYCPWQRYGTALDDGQGVDLSRSLVSPPARRGALVRALLDALGRGDVDLEHDDALMAALHGAVVAVRVRLVRVNGLVIGVDQAGRLCVRGQREQYMPLIVRFLPLLQ